MKRVFKQLAARRKEVAAHPLFIWLNSNSVMLEKRFVFAPVMIDFIMGFADMNKWFLSYEQPHTELERNINEHTQEDRTHSRLFYENWYTLDLGDVSAWPPGKALWWLFQSADSSVVRRFGMEILDLAVSHPDPMVRFPMMEAIELCGDVFFANTAPIATTLAQKHGVHHVYFGEYHRVRETGHLHTDEAAFVKAQLNEAQLEAALSAAHQVFDRFILVLDQLLGYAQRAAAEDGAHLRELDDEYRMALEAPRPRSMADGLVPEASCAPCSDSQVPLVRQLEGRIERLRNHGLLRWLRHERGVAADEKLQRFMALWGVDIVGYCDFNELVLRYPAPTSAEEHYINAWTKNLASHASLYLQDWQALDMDRAVPWNMGETIAFYFLSDQTEVHRRNMAKVKKLAFGHKAPLMRYWLMSALEKSGEPLFECTARLARDAESQRGVVLNYWAGRHSLAHPVSEPIADPNFLSAVVDAEEARVISQIIDTVFDNMEEQFSLSLHEAERAVFVRAPTTLPPPRMSDVVRRAHQESMTPSFAANEEHETMAG